jgi:hypothetical protein
MLVSADLASWHPIFTNAPVFGELDFTDEVAAGPSGRFYRATEVRP